MGGLLFKTQRLSKNEFEKYMKDVISILKKHTTYNFYIPKWFEDKSDFGDLDIVIESPIDIELIKKIFKPKKTYLNGSVFSIMYNNFQIDFIVHTTEDFESSKNYYSYNDLGNLIGRLAQKFKLKFGPDGLRYVYYVDTKKLGEFNISKDIEKILTFLDLNYQKYITGFKNRKELFNFIIKSKYFNPYIYDFDTLNHVNRSRNKKRSTYIAWLEYIKPLKKFYYKNEIFVNKTKLIPTINNYFFENNELFEWIIERDKEFEKSNAIKEKFNGYVVMDYISDLKGIKLGEFLLQYKKFIGEDMFEKYILNTDRVQIINSFVDFYKNEFIKK